MSGHSKWHNIQARKGKQDALKSNMFSKLSKLITIAAKNGADPTTNFSLRLAIEKAKSVGMPKDNIERAIKKGSGAIEGEQLEEILYEGYGPGGVAILVKAVSDNKNRTLQEVKHILSKNGGSLGTAGSVLWMFEQWGFIQLLNSQISSKNINRDDFDLMMIENGAEDILLNDDILEIKTKVENLKKISDYLLDQGYEIKESGLIWEPKDKVSISEEIRHKLENMFSLFEDNDEVEDWYTNAD